jgi:hypothetical protein
MPTAFAISTATTTVRLEAGEVQFTVTNTSGRPLRARLRAVALQPEAQGWFTAAGETERPFALGETQQVTVRLAVPPQTPAGSYAVRLDAAAEDNPDDDSVQGPSVTVEVPPPPPKKPIPWWLLLAAVAVVLLLIGGGAAFFLLRDDGGTEVPDVAGQPVATAKASLSAANLTPGAETPEVSSEVPLGQVIRTDPAAGEKVDDEPVDMIVSQGPPVTLPLASVIVGQTFAQAEQTIQNACAFPPCLSVVPSSAFSTLATGQVITTNPDPGSEVQPGSAVTVYVDTEEFPIFDGVFVDEAAVAEAERVFARQCDIGITAACSAFMPTPAP